MSYSETPIFDDIVREFAARDSNVLDLIIPDDELKTLLAEITEKKEDALHASSS